MGLRRDHGVAVVVRDRACVASVPGHVVVVLGVTEGVQRQVDEVDVSLEKVT